MIFVSSANIKVDNHIIFKNQDLYIVFNIYKEDFIAFKIESNKIETTLLAVECLVKNKNRQKCSNHVRNQFQLNNFPSL